MKKVFQFKFILLVTTLVAASFLYQFFPDKDVSAGSEHNLSGWAWSETIGWISFNSTNQGGGANYGVNVANGGNMSGYGWSEHIGWISFNDSAGCPSAPCQPRMNPGTGEVSGWARACAGTVNGDCTGASRTDGWDGWVHLRGANYGVSVAGCQWNGYAWGSDVVGWIHFRGANYGVDGSGDACLSVGPPPSASLTADPNSINLGDSSTLEWTCTNSNLAAIDQGVGTLCDTRPNPDGCDNGTTSVSPISDTTYTLTCTGPGGLDTDPASVNVTSVLSPAADIRANGFEGTTPPLPVNSSASITWCGAPALDCLNASSCSVTQDGSAWQTGTSGTFPTGPLARDTIYTLTCSNALGDQNTDSVRVDIASGPSFKEIPPR